MDKTQKGETEPLWHCEIHLSDNDSMVEREKAQSKMGKKNS